MEESERRVGCLGINILPASGKARWMFQLDNERVAEPSALAADESTSLLSKLHNAGGNRDCFSCPARCLNERRYCLWWSVKLTLASGATALGSAMGWLTAEVASGGF